MTKKEYRSNTLQSAYRQLLVDSASRSKNRCNVSLNHLARRRAAPYLDVVRKTFAENEIQNIVLAEFINKGVECFKRYDFL